MIMNYFLYDHLVTVLSELTHNLNCFQRWTGDGELNSGCGADFVKVKQDAPLGMTLKAGVRHVSVDGDADRVVYYFKSADEKFHLLGKPWISLVILWPLIFKESFEAISWTNFNF